MRNGDLEDLIRKRPKDIGKPMSTMVDTGKEKVLYKINKRTGRAEITHVIKNK